LEVAFADSHLGQTIVPSAKQAGAQRIHDVSRSHQRSHDASKGDLNRRVAPDDSGRSLHNFVTKAEVAGPPKWTHSPAKNIDEKPDSQSQDTRKVWVVMVNPGRVNQGVYTVEDKQSQRVLAFEKKEDAEPFADKLHDKGGVGSAAPIQWDAAELSSFCRQGGFESQFVSEGTFVDPPDKNSYDIQAFAKAAGALNKEEAKSWESSQSIHLHRALWLQRAREHLEDMYARSVDAHGDDPNTGSI
jgi:hypothetical protein